ncbi:hypothetical protein [Streptomyces virginiae]|uniref:hypothetical protein n=1 Tax=Streptomyces virginiae TaxID=1961 RepID=UPI003820E976
MPLRLVDPPTVRSYAEPYVWPAPGELIASPLESWAADWKAADPGRCTHFTR